MAADTEQRKRVKYAHLDHTHFSVPVAVETLGAMGAEALSFFKEVARRIASVTNKPRSYQYLLQRVAIAETLIRFWGQPTLGTFSDFTFTFIICLFCIFNIIALYCIVHVYILFTYCHFVCIVSVIAGYCVYCFCYAVIMSTYELCVH